MIPLLFLGGIGTKGALMLGIAACRVTNALLEVKRNPA